MKKTVIVGGNGYIGSALYKKIDADSIDLCLFGPDLGYSIKQNFHTIDFSKYENIILLAGHSSVQMCEFNRHNAWINNVDYFYHLCERLSSSQKLIYASSGSVYGQSIGESTETSLNTNPINHYDLTKISIDIIASRFINSGKQIIGLRFGTVNGGSPNTRSDLMINSMIKHYKQHGCIQTKNDWVKRPLLGIEDLTDGITAILHAPSCVPGMYNMASFNTTVRDIANTIAQTFACKIVKLPSDTGFYDFEISTKKFEDTFNFKFKDTPISIINSLADIEVSSIFSRDNDVAFNDFV
jgi:nucleoside-diphosphate-sugar epimerase